jgi:hypothetical protein
VTITKRPSSKSVADFIAGAPDAAAVQKAGAQPLKTGKPGRPVKAEKPVQISMTLPADLLANVDRQAEALSISRAAFVKQVLSRAVHFGVNQ